MKLLSKQEKEKIAELYDSGLNAVEIKREMGLKNHQQVYNVLKYLPQYQAYKYGRGDNRKYTLNEDYFKIINSEEKAYIFGFICADGHVAFNRLRILVATKDKDILEKIRVCLESSDEVEDVIRESRFSYGKRLFYHSQIAFNSIKLAKDLLNLGLDSRKTYSLSSKILENIPLNYMKDFLRGYFDGDGNVMYGNKYSSGKKYLIQIAGNKEFLENSFGKYFPTTNKYYFFPKSIQTWCYKLSSKENVNKFLEYIYKDSTIFLNRKYNIYKNNVAI